VEALADAICLLLNDKILVRKNTDKAKQEIGQLSWKRSAEKLAGIYKSLHKETESL
jgi:glycosyltransferase involved in cell wall biosynthesis